MNICFHTGACFLQYSLARGKRIRIDYGGGIGMGNVRIVHTFKD